jgi:uncharacterized protein (DUF302 family)
MTIRNIVVERLTVTSPKPFEAVVAALEAAVGRPDVGALMRAAEKAGSLAEMEGLVRGGLGRTGLMLFMKLDHGAILRRETGLATPKLARFLVRNPLIMKEMAKRIPDAGSYAPVTVLVDERPDGVHLSYDRMASLLAPYGDPDALAAAKGLDLRIEALMREAAGELMPIKPP